MGKNLAIAISVAALLMAGAASGEAPTPDYGRSGWYVGVGGGAGWNFLSDAIQNRTNDLIHIDSGGSVNARGGYRILSWLAIEGMYEGVFGLDIIENITGSTLASFDSHSLLVNLKFIAPIWRVHPYFALGGGAQYGDFDGLGPILDPLDTERWDPVIRFGFGVDGYVTENWVLNLEIAPGIRFADYGNIPSQTTDNVTLTFSGGVQYRF